MVAAAAVALGPSSVMPRCRHQRRFCHPRSLRKSQQINFLTAAGLMQILASELPVHCNLQFHLCYHCYLTEGCMQHHL